MSFENLPMSKMEICTEDYFFPNRRYSHLDTRSFTEYEIGMHLHEFYEINIVLKGKGIHCIENNMYKIKKGYVFVIPPGIYHGYKNLGELEVYHILVGTKYLSRYASELECMGGYINLFSIEPIIRSNTEYSFFLTLDDTELEFISELSDILEKVKKNSEDVHRNNYDLMINSMGLNIIEALCHYYEKHSVSEYEKNTEKYKRIANNIQFICNNYDKKITLKMLADNMNMSQSAYVKLFNKVLKMPPMQYVVNYRISRAKSLLENTDMTITEIAHRTGFYDSAHLNKMFLSHEKLCPTDYKNNSRK